MNGFVPHQLIVAAAQAAGPRRPGLEAAWHSRVRELALNLYLDGTQLAADIARVEGAKDRVRGVLTRVEIEESSNRAIIYIKALGRGEERFRTDRLENDSGKALYATAQRLIGRLVRVYKELETPKAQPGERPSKVRMAVHLVDLGPADGAVAEKDAKDMMIEALAGDTKRAGTAWRAACLPESGPVDQEQLEAALAAVTASATTNDGAQDQPAGPGGSPSRATAGCPVAAAGSAHD
ncbi:hypothetical protein ACIBBE_45580 [Streptomyces sp. NPDC051644]|uniref:hypothetical protein n=1 Tax=Streptomyces sp. NPDC051644 TaxID=3365666 RepID=UPI0037BE1857